MPIFLQITLLFRLSNAILSIFAAIKLMCRMKSKCFYDQICRAARMRGFLVLPCFVLMLCGSPPAAAQPSREVRLRIPVGHEEVFDAGRPIEFRAELLAARGGGSGILRMEVASDCGVPVVAFIASYDFARDSTDQNNRFCSRASFRLPALLPGCYEASLLLDGDRVRNFRFSCEPTNHSAQPGRSRK
ncbi:MAG: hypothetical protein K2N04_04780 [Alistipes sp.]|nr:hypothetical protein [Alistipes sp.]